MINEIDEAIQSMKRKYDRIEKLNGKTGEYHSAYDKKNIEWLEELKELRVLIKSYENAPSDAYWYNKGWTDAVNEFANWIITNMFNGKDEFWKCDTPGNRPLHMSDYVKEFFEEQKND